MWETTSYAGKLHQEPYKSRCALPRIIFSCEMIGIVWASRLFDDDDCDEEEEPQQETETGPRTGQSNGGDTA